MTSDEPDEDADNLDDEKLLEGFLDGPQAITPQAALAGPQDWPYRYGGKDNLVVDADILTWFKTNHEDWQRQIGCVLRAWIVACSRADASDQHRSV
jgi:hypothetical protein